MLQINPAVAQQPEWIQRQTVDGCLFIWWDKRISPFDYFKWSAPCSPGSLIEGQGTMTMDVKESLGKRPNKLELTFANGVIVGDAKFNGKGVRFEKGCPIGPDGKLAIGCVPGSAPTTVADLLALPKRQPTATQVHNRCIDLLFKLIEPLQKDVINKSGDRFDHYSVKQVNQHYVAQEQLKLRLFRMLPSCRGAQVEGAKFEASLREQQEECRKFESGQCEDGVYHTPDKAQIDALFQKLVAQDTAEEDDGTVSPSAAAAAPRTSAPAPTPAPTPPPATANAPSHLDEDPWAANVGATEPGANPQASSEDRGAGKWATSVDGSGSAGKEGGGCSGNFADVDQELAEATRRHAESVVRQMEALLMALDIKLGKLSGCADQGAKMQTAELQRIRNQTQETCNRTAVKAKCVPQW